MTSIPITGLSASDAVPGNYIQINWATGDSAAVNTYPALLIGNKLAAGSATNALIYGPDTSTSLTSELDAIALFGRGSELHRMYKAFVRSNKSTSVYCLPSAESAGAQATGSFVLASTATANGTLRVFIQDEFVDVPIANGDGYATVAANAVIQINGRGDLPVTASSSGGTVTLTAKQKGLRGNALNFSTQVLPSCGVTATVSTTTNLSGGSTADDVTTALAAIASTSFAYIVPAFTDSTNLALISAQVSNMAAPIIGIRQRVIAGSTTSLSTTQALSVALNNARVDIMCQPSGEVEPALVACQLASVVALEEDVSVPFLTWDSYGNTAYSRSKWWLKAPKNVTPPTRAQIAGALSAGVSPVGTNRDGSTYLVKRITTYFNSAAAVDYRIRDSFKVTVCDRFASAVEAKLSTQFAHKLIGDDPIKGGETPPANVVTPRNLKAMLAKLVKEFAADAMVQDEVGIIAGIQVNRESSPRNRLTARVPLMPVDTLSQLGVVIDQK